MKCNKKFWPKPGKRTGTWVMGDWLIKKTCTWCHNSKGLWYHIMGDGRNHFFQVINLELNLFLYLHWFSREAFQFPTDSRTYFREQTLGIESTSIGVLAGNLTLPWWPIVWRIWDGEILFWTGLNSCESFKIVLSVENSGYDWVSKKCFST